MTNVRLEELREKFNENPRRYFAPFANELRKTGDPSQAIAICRAQLASQPGHVSGHIVLAQALQDAGEIPAARETFTAALNLDPENLIALRSMGELAYGDGQFAEARQWYQRLLDADPRNDDVHQIMKALPEEGAARAAFAPGDALSDWPSSPDQATVRPRSDSAGLAGLASGVTPRKPEPRMGAERDWVAPPSIPGVPDAPQDDYLMDSEAGHGAGSATHAEPEAPLAPADFVEPAAEPAVAGQVAEPEPLAFEAWPTAPENEPPMMEGGEFEQVEGLELAAFAETEALESTPPSAMDLAYGRILDLSDLEAAPFDTGVEGEIAATGPEAGVDAREAGEHLPLDGLELGSVYPSEFAAELPGPDTETPEVQAGQPEAETAAEPPRAIFAEYGFEGTALDAGDILLTGESGPAASDPAALPEDWFDEPVVASVPEPEALLPPSSEQEAAAPAVSEASPELRVDSWFDEVPGEPVEPATAAAVEDLWLAPDLGAGRAEAWEGSEVAMAQSAETPGDAAPVAPELASAGGDPAGRADTPEPVAEEAPEELVVFVEAEVVAISPEPPSPIPAETEVLALLAAEPEPPALPMVEPESPALLAAEAESPALHAPPFDAMSPASPAPFVTETLAELYLHQGFRAEALDIYRQLRDRSPTDAKLQSRIEEIERGPAAAPVAQAEPVARAPSRSQPVGSFLRRFATRMPAGGSLGGRLGHGTSPGEAAGSAGASAPADAEEPTGPPFGVAATALSGLFAASRTPPADEGAAAALAGTFAPPPPSGPAPHQLSLGHLFRDVPSGETRSVRMDEFFASSPPLADPAARAAEGAGEEGTDIRQFTAWLEGLRKK